MPNPSSRRPAVKSIPLFPVQRRFPLRKRTTGIAFDPSTGFGKRNPEVQPARVVAVCDFCIIMP